MTGTLVPEPILGAAADLLARTVGLRSDSALRGRLGQSLVEEAEAHNLDLSIYVGQLESQPELLQGLLDRVTVQETAFFRDPSQFAALREAVLPGLSAPLRIWSAGCSTGQEPYSLAIELTESGVPDWRIVATDISSLALERTRRGRYAAREMGGLSPSRRARHFRAAEADWEVTAELHQRVEVVHHNLVASPPPFEPGECDVVFCRNVLIYLREDDVRAFLMRLARWLRPGAWLFVGSAESLWQATGLFELARVGDAFLYKRKDPERPDRAPSIEARPRPIMNGPPRRSSPSALPRPSPDPVAERALAPPIGSVSSVMAEGETALRAGAYDVAIRAFRKCAYLDPDHVIARLHLGLALEAAGDPAAARSAFGAARAVLERSDPAEVESALKGYHSVELVRLLDAKLKETPCAP